MVLSFSLTLVFGSRNSRGVYQGAGKDKRRYEQMMEVKKLNLFFSFPYLFCFPLVNPIFFFISLGSSSQIVIRTQPIRCVWSVIFLGLGVEYGLSFVH